MVKKSDFGQREVEASKSVLVELIHILGELDALIHEFLPLINHKFIVGKA